MSDGGYLVVGATASNDGDVSGNHGDYDAWIARLDASGDLLWQRTLGGSGTDMANAVQLIAGDRVLIAGSTWSMDGDMIGTQGFFDAWLAELDAEGNVNWLRTYGGPGWDEALAIDRSGDHHYILAGNTDAYTGDEPWNHGGLDLWIMNVDSVGTMQWRSELGGSYVDGAYAVQTMGDGSVLAAGFTHSDNGDASGNHGFGDAWVVGYGESFWQNTLGGSFEDRAFAVQRALEGGCLVAGFTRSTDGDVTSTHGSGDLWVLRLGSAGGVLWQKTFGGTGYDHANAIRQTADGGSVVAGLTASNDGDASGFHGGPYDLWLIRLDAVGNLLWQKAMGGTALDRASDVRITTDGGYVIAGYSASNDGDVSGGHGDNDVWVVKLASDDVGVEEEGHNAFLVSSDPGNRRITISSARPSDAHVALRDARGCEVAQARLNGTSLTLDVNHHPAGLYLLTLISEQGSGTYRVVLE